MGEGRLTATAVIPLDAPDFRYDLSATLGRMPARAFNRFLSVNEAFEFDRGEIDEVTVRQRARGGLAITTLTPRYHDLSVKPTGDGGGVVGAVTRGLKKFIANAFVVRGGIRTTTGSTSAPRAPGGATSRPAPGCSFSGSACVTRRWRG
jgi:hypothetical protein